MYTKIFDEVIDIIHKDYAGFEDKKGWDQPELFKRKLEEKGNSITPVEFVEIVRDYLVDFKDHHIHFVRGNMGEMVEREFKVRRYEDRLYVVSVHSDSNLTVGEAIVELDGLPILELRKRYARYLNENHVERENWNPILLKHDTCTVEHPDGTRSLIPMKRVAKTPFKATYTIKALDEGTVLITLTDFADPDAISNLVREHEALLDEAEYLIVDVRINNGGNDASFNCLAPYFFPEGETELTDLDEVIFNCTERTSDLVVAMIEEEMQHIQDQTTRKMLALFKDFYENNRGKGFVRFDFNDVNKD